MGAGQSTSAQPDLATSVYHEIRSPLGLIITAAHAAAEATADEAVRRHLDAIVRVAERALRVAGTIVEHAHHGQAGQAAVPPAGLFYPVTVLDRFVLDLRAVGVVIEWERESGVDGCLASGAASDFEALLHTAFEDALDHGAPGAAIRVTAAIGPSSAPCLDISVTNRIGEQEHAGLRVGTHLRRDIATRLGVTLSAGRKGADYQLNLMVPVVQPRARGARARTRGEATGAQMSAGGQHHAGAVGRKDPAGRALPAARREGQAC